MKRGILISLLMVLSVWAATAQLNRSYFFIRGRDNIIQGHYTRAIEALNVLLRSDTTAYEGYFLRGVAKYNLDDMQGATYDFSRAIRQNPVYTIAYQYRGITRSQMGDYSGALADFDRAIELRPNNASSYFSRGVANFLNHQFENSIEDYNQFLIIEPMEPDGYINRGTSYLYLNDTLSAARDYNRAVEIHPYYKNGYLRRGMLNLVRNQNDLAIEDMSRALGLDSTYSIAYFYRASAKSSKGRLSEALHDFDNAIRYDSTNSVTFFNRALLRNQVGDLNRALEDYDRVARYNPQNVLVLYNRAGVHAALGHYVQSVADYTKAIELYPDFANAYLNRSIIFKEMGQMARSKRDMQVAQSKIDEYRSKITPEAFSQYADTSLTFTKLLAFDADFGNKEFREIGSTVSAQIKLLPMYRMAVDTTSQHYAYGHNPLNYRSEEVEKYISSRGVKSLSLSNLSMRVDSPESADNDLLKGLRLTHEHKYSEAMDVWNRMVKDNPADPFILMNGAVAEVEMIEFIASLEAGYQTIQIDSDPLTRLKSQNRQTSQTYDYSAPITKLRKAISLMPGLPHLYYNMGNILCLSGDLPAAIVQYDKAIALYPTFGQAYYNRGLVKIMLGEGPTGRMDISRAGELGVNQAYRVLKGM